MKGVRDSYGERAKLAANNEGIDWKAVSHAMRVAFEMECIATIGTINFPLGIATLLKHIKQGKKDYNTEVKPMMEELIQNAERVIEESDLPKEVDKEYWNEFILDVYRKQWMER